MNCVNVCMCYCCVCAAQPTPRARACVSVPACLYRSKRVIPLHFSTIENFIYLFMPGGGISGKKFFLIEHLFL